jgi:hypothetical protein
MGLEVIGFEISFILNSGFDLNTREKVVDASSRPPWFHGKFLIEKNHHQNRPGNESAVDRVGISLSNQPS